MIDILSWTRKFKNTYHPSNTSIYESFDLIFLDKIKFDLTKKIGIGPGLIYDGKEIIITNLS